VEYKKKLIEVALPLEEINSASAREKSIRHGHPSTLHLWWARRPLAAARAVIWSSLVDDPSAHPDQFPTEEAQNIERERLFDILRDLVIWENSTNKEVLDAAKAEIMKSTDGKPPALLDPFAGGGAIPLEAQRLGLKAYASDLNPVAVMINKAMIEIPPQFAGQPPVNPEAKNQIRTWEGSQGLAEDVRYYGQWMKNRAFEKIGHLYPKIKDEHGIERTVIAWIWTRTVKCPNPDCGCEMPLANSFELSKKKGKEAYVLPIIDGKTIRYEVRYGKGAPKPPKTGRGQFRCICCGQPVQGDYVRSEFQAKHSGAQMMAVIAEGPNGRLYFSPNEQHREAANSAKPAWKPEEEMNTKSTDLVSGRGYGITHWHELFTQRQLTALTTLSDLVADASTLVREDGGSEEYAKAISVYLAFLVDQLANHSSAFSGWNSPNEQMRAVFSRQAIPMVWDFAESNVFSSSSGGYSSLYDRLTKAFSSLGNGHVGEVFQKDAQAITEYKGIMISTDPPYYDNISYADLSDFFYVWLRRMLRPFFPDWAETMATPKKDELIVSPSRFNGNTSEAKDFFENGMRKTFSNMFAYCNHEIPLTIYYAYKQSETDDSNEKHSPGWETILNALIVSGFTISGTWPIRTEKKGRMLEYETNALASSIVLVCRKRTENAPTITRREFINTLKRELKPALQKLQASNIAPVDMAQAAIGPGMGVYSRYAQVLEADGTPMSVRTALQLINQELDVFFNEQDGELDRDSRFCVELYSQAAFNEIKFGEADVLARAKNTSVDGLAQDGLLLAEKGIVRLLTREELPALNWTKLRSSWMLTQQLTKAMESGGNQATAAIIATLPGGSVEQAKALAYRLFSIAERKGWAKEAFAYNSLVNAWKEVQTSAAEIAAASRDPKQGILFDT